MGATWGTFMVPHGHAHGACETKRSRQWLSVRVDVLRMCCERTWWLCWGRQDGQSGLIQAPNVRAFYRGGSDSGVFGWGIICAGNIYPCPTNGAQPQDATSDHFTRNYKHLYPRTPRSQRSRSGTALRV